MEKMYFLDNASTTKPFDEIKDLYDECAQNFYNPSALYDKAVLVRKKIETARKNICKYIGGEEGTLYFTASATEANNMAISSVKYHSKELVVSALEHPAVYEVAKSFQNAGVSVKFLDYTSNGITIEEIKSKVTKNTALVSMMHVSNEAGIINDIKLLTKEIKKINPKIIVHVDGVQAFGKIPVDLMDLGVDMYTLSAHKIHGLKGVGALWVKNHVNVAPIIYGGGQESGVRSGTENVLGILAFELAAKKVSSDVFKNAEIARKQKQTIIDGLNKNNVKYVINGDSCSPYILSISVDGLRGEVLVHSLEKYGIYIATGSACSSKKTENRALENLGRTPSQIKGSIRISFSAYNNYDLTEVADIIAKEINKIVKTIKG